MKKAIFIGLLALMACNTKSKQQIAEETVKRHIKFDKNNEKFKHAHFEKLEIGETSNTLCIVGVEHKEICPEECFVLDASCTKVINVFTE